MSADVEVKDGNDLNTNNSSKTNVNTINNLDPENDDASNLVADDVEEIICKDEPSATSNESKPDVYEPPNRENSCQSNEAIKEGETGNKNEGDKWAMPSSHNININGADIKNEDKVTGSENEMEVEENLKVNLPSIVKDTCSSKSSSNDAETEASSREQVSDDLMSVSSSNSEKDSNLTVKLPPLDREAAQKVKQENLESKSPKPDIIDKTEEQSHSPTDDKSSTGSLEGVYQVKWVKFKGKDVPVITQNENGPCPLLAIMNVLLLKGKIKFPTDTEMISSEQMMSHLGECILANKPQNVTEVVQLNYEQNMQDAMAVFHKLQTGLDVNVRFNGVSEFEYTPECIIFDLLSIALYHGWLVDPQNTGEVSAIGNCSYNQLVEKIISQRSSESNDLITEALVAEGFLDRTASQLTYHGLCELSSTVKPDQLCVFFRNNHFCTLYRHKDELFLLVTDQGFLDERKVVWETLNNVEGDHYFVDSEFHTYTKPVPQEPVLPPDVSANSDEQVNHDYLLAMSLQQEQQICDEQIEVAEASHQRVPMSDAELAARLQAEEDAQAAQGAAQQQAQHHGNVRTPPSGNQGQQRSRERERPRERERQRDRSKEKDSNCNIL